VDKFFNYSPIPGIIKPLVYMHLSYITHFCNGFRSLMCTIPIIQVDIFSCSFALKTSGSGRNY